MVGWPAYHLLIARNYSSIMQIKLGFKCRCAVKALIFCRIHVIQMPSQKCFHLNEVSLCKVAPPFNRYYVPILNVHLESTVTLTTNIFFLRFNIMMVLVLSSSIHGPENGMFFSGTCVTLSFNKRLQRICSRNE